MTKPQPNDDALTSAEIRGRLYEISSQALLIAAVMRGRPDLREEDELGAVMDMATGIRTQLLRLAGGEESAFLDHLDRLEALVQEARSHETICG
ncbi:MAG: hypothetical protein ACREDO_00215 [Methyloceanibacter sp.]